MNNRKLSMDELNRLTVEQYKNLKKIPIVVVLDNIRSMHNVGSFYRTADACHHCYLSLWDNCHAAQ